MRRSLTALAGGLLALISATALAQPAAAPPPAAPAAPLAPYDKAVQDRIAGRLDLAIAELLDLKAKAPKDADVYLNLGLAYSAKGDFKNAEAVLAEGLEISPKYTDMQVAYARLAYFRSEEAEARRRLEPALAGPANAEASDLLKQINRAERDAMGLPWRVDVSVAYSGVSGGSAPWRETDVALGRKIDAHSSFSVGIEQTDRFGVSNTYFHGEYSHSLGQFGLFLGYGGSPDAVYRASNYLQAGVSAPPLQLGSKWSLVGEIDGSWGRYPTGDVSSVQPLVTLQRGDDFSLSARYLRTTNELHQVLTGYVVTGAVSVSPIVHLSAGYASAPDSSSGVAIEMRSASGGLAVDVSDATTVRVNASHETGGFNIRDDIAVGLTHRF